MWNILRIADSVRSSPSLARPSAWAIQIEAQSLRIEWLMYADSSCTPPSSRGAR
jgi:hypothetical protein